MSTTGRSKACRTTGSARSLSPWDCRFKTTRLPTYFVNGSSSAERCDSALWKGRAQRCVEKGLMSALCNGKVQREGHYWHCLDCGCVSTSWDTKHQPLQTRAAHFIACLVEIASEADKQVHVGAASAAL